MRDEVFVTGIGMLASSGVGSREVFDAVLDKRIVTSERSYLLQPDSTLTYPVYPVASLHLCDWVDAETFRWLQEIRLDQDADFVYLVVVSLLALRNSNLKVDSNTYLSLVVGHENLGVVNLLDKLLNKQNTAQNLPNSSDSRMSEFQKYKDDFYKIQSFPHLFYLAKVLGVRGVTLTVNNACASGLYALEVGKLLIQSRQSEVVLVVSSDYAHVTEYLWLKERGFQSSTSNPRPFDRNRDGSVLGDGAAAFVIESFEHAAKRQAKPICIYGGAAFRQEFWRMTLPDVTAHTYSKVIEEVYRQVECDSIDLLIPHGTGSPLWDRYEAQEIQLAFQKMKIPIPEVTAFKGYVGHTLGASSLLEAAILIESMRSNCIPPLAFYSDPDEKIQLPLVTEPKEKRLKTVMKAVPAYGGFHTAAIFKKWE